MNLKYSPTFYRSYSEESFSSAKILSQHIVELIEPKSIIDVGCGIGTWLAAFEKLGISNLKGIDGNYVQTDQLLISPSKFQAVDLNRDLSEIATTLGSFELALSLEVAEHLSKTQAHEFVQFLTKLSSLVVFSAAIPLQGGTLHRNEQWQGYWAHLFEEEGYVAIDAFRPKIWDNPGVAYYYAQNTLLYVKKSSLSQLPKLLDLYEKKSTFLNVVHPRKWLEAHDNERASLKRFINGFPYALRNALRTFRNKISSQYSSW